MKRRRPVSISGFRSTRRARTLPLSASTHLRSKFALFPCANAVPANDTPGSRHRRTSSRLALCRTGIGRRADVREPGSEPDLPSTPTLASTPYQVGGHHPCPSIALRPDGLGMTLTLLKRAIVDGSHLCVIDRSVDAHWSQPCSRLVELPRSRLRAERRPRRTRPPQSARTW